MQAPPHAEVRMSDERPGTVIHFPQRLSPPGALTAQDREEIHRLRATAYLLGYDRLDIHEDTDPETGIFVTAYRWNDIFARWGFVRRDGAIVAWCCHTGADIGSYTNFADALLIVLPMT
jgi:hypothetical protein